MARFRCLALLGFVFLAGALAGNRPARAQGLIIGRPLPGPRPLPIPAPRPLTIKSERISLSVDSGAVRAQISQVFLNPTNAQMEGTYLFNLPEGAAVSNFRMQVDREPVDGKMLTVEEARRTYEQFVRQRIDPGILEYVGHNAFRARVFPIPASGEKEIQIGYSHPAGFQNGLYQVTYPLNTDRVSPEPLRELAVQCTIRSNQPIKAIYSPTHEIQVRRDNDHLATVTFEAKEIRANRDFVLYYSVSEKEFGLNALTNRKAGEDGYLMMMLAPKRDAAPKDVLPKDIVFVFDTSGSMQGAKIEQAKRALNTVLGALGSRDRFNITRFSTDVTSFRSTLVDVTLDNVRAARDFVSDLKAVGGTNIDEALQAAFASLPAAGPEKRAAFVIFMTDGIPTIGQTNMDQILANAAKENKVRARLFAFGVGHDVNAVLLDRLALNGSGAADYVGPDEDLETKIGSFYMKIANPVLSNLKIEVAGAQVTETYPGRLPDLFAGSQLLVLGRYRGTGKATVKVTGDIGGAPRSYTYEVALPAEEKEFIFIPKLWASRKIGFLLEEIRLHGENEELKNEVIRLSKEHGIITPYTAFLVEEPGLVPPGGTVERLGDLGGGRRGAVDAAGRGGLGGAGFGGGLAAGGVSRPAAGARGPAQPPSQNAGEEARLYYLRRQAADQQAFRQSTGRDAIGQSQRLRQLKEQTVDELEVQTQQVVQGRRFEWKEGGWSDATVTGKPTVVTVKFGSDAYFDILQRNPQWTKFMALGKSVTFRTGKSHVLKVSETAGKEKLTAAELKALAE
jgi:uncharacterized protein YegL